MGKSNYCDFLKLEDEIKQYQLENILEYSLIFTINEGYNEKQNCIT